MEKRREKGKLKKIAEDRKNGRWTGRFGADAKASCRWRGEFPSLLFHCSFFFGIAN
jgi:hypothetical protein